MRVAGEEGGKDSWKENKKKKDTPTEFNEKKYISQKRGKEDRNIPAPTHGPMLKVKMRP